MKASIDNWILYFEYHLTKTFHVFVADSQIPTISCWSSKWSRARFNLHTYSATCRTDWQNFVISCYYITNIKMNAPSANVFFFLCFSTITIQSFTGKQANRIIIRFTVKQTKWVVSLRNEEQFNRKHQFACIILFFFFFYYIFEFFLYNRLNKSNFFLNIIHFLNSTINPRVLRFITLNLLYVTVAVEK